MNEEAYNKILQKMKQIDSLNCDSAKIEFEINDSSRLWQFPPAKEIKHRFAFTKYGSIGSSIPSFVEIEHELLIDEDTVVLETYAYSRDYPDLSVSSIQYGGIMDCCRINVKDLHKINALMIFDDYGCVDFDEFFKKLDLKMIELV